MKTTVAIRPEYKSLGLYLIEMHKLTNPSANLGGIIEELLLAYATQTVSAVANPVWRDNLINYINNCHVEQEQRTDRRKTRHAK